MKFFIMIGFLFSLNAYSSCGGDTTFCSVKYNSTYDGDTFYVNIPRVHKLIGNRLGVRVKGIDTPELRGTSGEEKKLAYMAKDYLKNKLEKSKKIRLEDCERGKYFRLACRVLIDGKEVALEMIKLGLGEKYNK